MKKYIVPILFTISLLFLVGCSQNEAEKPVQNSEIYNEQSDFSIFKRTDENIIVIERNGTIFDIELPTEFTIEKRDLSAGAYNKKYLSSNTDSFEAVYEMLISDTVVGAVGITTYTASTFPAELIDVYGAVALANDYHFCVDEENYQTAKKNSTGEAGITKVYYSPVISKDVGYGGDTVYNDGILAYSDNDNVFVAMEFEAGTFEESQLKSIAQSINYIIDGSDIS